MRMYRMLLVSFLVIGTTVQVSAQKSKDAKKYKLKAAKIADVASQPHMIARVELGLAFRKLAEVAAGLSPIEKDQLRDGVFEDIAGWRTDLAASYKTDTPRKAAKPATPDADVSDEDWFKNKLDSIDLDNDDDLVSKHRRPYTGGRLHDPVHPRDARRQRPPRVDARRYRIAQKYRGGRCRRQPLPPHRRSKDEQNGPRLEKLSRSSRSTSNNSKTGSRVSVART